MAEITRGTFTNDLTSTQRVRSVAKEIYNINEGEDELLQLMMSRRRVTPVNSRKFEYNEQRLAPRTVTVTSVLNGTTLRFSQADAELIRKGTVLRLDRSVVQIVTTAPTYGASNVITVADTTGITQGDVLILAGYAGAEGENFPAAYYTSPTLQYNYLQEISNAWDISRWAKTEDRYDGPQVARNRKDALLYHKIACNQTLWYGTRTSTTDAASAAVLGTRGIMETITSNIGSFDNGIVTFKQLREAVGDYTLKSKSKELDLYVSPSVWAVLDQLWFEKQSISAPIVEKAGVAMRQIVLGPKMVNLVQAVCFEGEFQNMMVGIDPGYFEIKTGKDQDNGRQQWMLEFSQGAEQLGAQKQKTTFVTDLGACLVAEEAHFIMDNALATA